MEDKKLYDLNLSQDVVALQCRYTLSKNVVNILASMESENKLNFEVLKDALNIAIKRNDCLRIRFQKEKGVLKQYFLDEYVIENVPRLEFATEAEFDAFVKGTRKKPIKYMKGVIIEPYFITIAGEKDMLFVKICHLIIDVYGINNLFKDIFAVYDALINKTELPEAPTAFEDVLVEDLKRKFNKEFQESNREYFRKELESTDVPWYAGIHGKEDPIWQKRLKKGKRTMQMFFINNQTEGYSLKIGKDIMDKVTKYCEATKQSMANFMFYTSSICASMINDKVENMLPLELYNCRTTGDAKLCAGTKVQSLACYTTVDYSKSFEENFNNFCAAQRGLYRHVGFADTDYENMRNKIYKNSMLETYYSITFSFIPYEMPKGLKYNMYSNGNGALPAYIAQLYDIKTGEVEMAYDCHIKTTPFEKVKAFHEKYVDLINKVIENPNKKLDDIQI